ncbi:MAG: hypothetical protein U0L72_08530 [Acutalibacteraceae bacterium]|nr:hypothetical protein [Acutalibacteraceae bacterium]
MSIADKFEVIADAVYDKGVSDGENNVWSAAIPPGRTYFRYAFTRWKDTDFSHLEGVKITDAFWMFSYSGVKELDFNLDLTKCTAVNQMFYGCSHLKKIKKIIFSDKGDLGFNQTFYGANVLEEISIEGVIGKEISFESCKLLNRASIESIIKHLSTAQGATLTLSAEAVNREFTTAEWDAFIAEYKPSTWSIALK